MHTTLSLVFSSLHKEFQSLSPVVFVSIANISSFLQVAFMFDVTAVTDKIDSQILRGCLITTILQTILPLAVEYTLVNVSKGKEVHHIFDKYIYR